MRLSHRICIAILATSCAARQNHNSTENYARIAVLNYSNQTASTDFDYLSESLGDATRNAMRGRFDFREVQMQPSPDSSEDDTIKAAGGKADILILGSYGREAVSGTKGKKSEQLTISGKIYSLRHRKVLAEYSRKAAVDARIFTTVNDIAQEAVHSIQAYTRKINEDQTVVDPKTGKEALTLERLKLKVFVPPMF
ncbi:MAG: hypothetical protein KF713_19205 [Turneriella sp.]|nr:hypothetical protein [Turneriella sp.]